MNPSDPNDSLSRTLAVWRVSPKTNPDFRPAVWQRIRTGTRETWSSYLRAHRLGWSVAAMFAVVVAGVSGRVAARAHLEASRDRMVVAYLGALDPRVQAKLHPATK